MFEIDGVKLRFSSEALDYFAEKAIEYQLGARGLRGLIENVMTDLMYETPESNKKEITISQKFAKDQFERFAGKFNNIEK